VSVCGTGTLCLPRGFSWQSEIRDFVTYLSLPITAQSYKSADLPTLQPRCLAVLFQSHGSRILLRHPLGQTTPSGTGISTCCPSPTPFGLSLGPDLPWVDEPSPGTLRLSAGRILTCLFVYSYRHSHFLSVHTAFRQCFDPIRTLPYQSISEFRSFGVTFSPGHFPRRVTRPVSYYALFEWWLLLSQHPGCLCNPTSFPT
jgi:hypothetical protein